MKNRASNIKIISFKFLNKFYEVDNVPRLNSSFNKAYNIYDVTDGDDIKEVEHFYVSTKFADFNEVVELFAKNEIYDTATNTVY